MVNDKISPDKGHVGIFNKEIDCVSNTALMTEGS